MSCEWFIKPPEPCACCGRAFEPVQIGVSAIGWEFYFKVAPGRGDGTEAIWREVIGDQTVIDEYDSEFTADWFWGFVERKRGGRKQ